MLDLTDEGGKAALFAVLDGHGGAEVARFVANHLVSAGTGVERARGNCWGGGDVRVCVVHRTAAALHSPSLHACHATQPAGQAPVLTPPAHAPPRPATRPPSGREQAQQVLATPGWQAGDPERALKEVYLRMDELLVKVIF